jgi:SAM-dependent methyltransferase
MSCPICGNHEFWMIPAALDLQAEHLRSTPGEHSGNEWRLCRRCGNAYPLAPPDVHILQELWALNRTDSGASVSEQTKTWAYRRAIAKAGAERSYRLFAPLVANHFGCFLDIACGLGETVRTFAANGWDAEGVDADPSTEPFHRELGIRARIGQFETLDVGTGYDIIHIAHAIYFITDPMHFMRIVRERLSPRGFFCVVLADFLASADLSLPSYVHTFFPTGSSMRYALACAGFETVLCKRLSGSIFIAARHATMAAPPTISPSRIRFLYQTKALRYALVGRPYLLLRRIIKRLVGRR